MSPIMDETYLREAIRLSKEKMLDGVGGPFGAVVVCDGEIVGRGWNQVTSTNDPTAHAEVVAIRQACRHLDTFQLSGCTLYTSCEPCPMCLAAAYWSRIERIVYAASREDAAAAGFDDQFFYDQLALPMDDRALPAMRLLSNEAQEAFAAWLAKEDRIEY